MRSLVEKHNSAGDDNCDVPLARVTSIANEPNRTFETIVADCTTDALTGPTTNAVASPVSELTVTDAERPEGEVTTMVVADPLVESGCITCIVIVGAKVLISRVR